MVVLDLKSPVVPKFWAWNSNSCLEYTTEYYFRDRVPLILCSSDFSARTRNSEVGNRYCGCGLCIAVRHHTTGGNKLLYSLLQMEESQVLRNLGAKLRQLEKEKQEERKKHEEERRKYLKQLKKAGISIGG